MTDTKMSGGKRGHLFNTVGCLSTTQEKPIGMLGGFLVPGNTNTHVHTLMKTHHTCSVAQVYACCMYSQTYTVFKGQLPCTPQTRQKSKKRYCFLCNLGELTLLVYTRCRRAEQQGYLRPQTHKCFSKHIYPHMLSITQSQWESPTPFLKTCCNVERLAWI